MHSGNGRRSRRVARRARQRGLDRQTRRTGGATENTATEAVSARRRMIVGAATSPDRGIAANSLSRLQCV